MKRFLLSLAVLAPMALLTACNDDDSSPQPTPPAPPAASYVRVVHASPDAPAVDVALDGTNVVTNASFKAATGFLQTTAGAHTVRVNAAGTTTTVLSASPTLAGGKYYTVFAANKLAALEPLVVEEEAAAPASGKIKLRVVHAAPSAPAVDVHVTAPAAALGTPTLSNVPFKGISAALEVDAGDYRVRVTPAGSTTVVYDSGKLSLAAGANLVAAAIDASTGNSPVSLLVLTRDIANPVFEVKDQRALVRAVHASPNAPSVDILVNNAVALSNVPFPVASAYLDPLAGTYNFKVNAAGTSTTVINADVPLEAGKKYSVVAANFLANIEPLVFDDTTAKPAAGKAKLRIAHLSPDAPNVDILANDAALVSNVPFKAKTDYLEVAAATYAIKVNVAGTSTTALSANLTLESGKIYSVYAVGSLAGSTLQLKVLNDN
ncbi:DUF4397 domain-containing protein [Chitinimonas sp. BJYL2]|uniref:DUF4397 domain-containing protein n=1 Tax=Chitinimonas sp. BJYL2 TaxID=2976696 RepID=UPI0022B36FA2|nr:DUF4397 domain-containing protein [Chitinimonas sp. BJYL2]